ncbi:ABC transporter substrate-binding protein [Acidisphaera sp. L21]|uniref:ABC transporter substrate-binding protein n=1 Tax=Acidisphaera sp. L21 TaxID=1641851 RepID=UPI00131D9C5F|nr:ABC transporter substrate-binding protein [Acidisphaera sp. L21]
MAQRQFWMGTAAAAIAVALALPCVAAEPKQGGAVVYAYASGPRTLDPHIVNNTVEIEVVNQIYESLVALGEDYSAKPELASHVEVAADNKTFTFALRHGVKFQNGKEMTAADVIASFERYQKVSPNAEALAEVAGYDTPDPYTFVIRLKTPNAIFLDVLKTPSYPFSILPAEERDKPAGAAAVIGTGPFKLGEWVKDGHLTLQRFDGYVSDPAATGLDGYAGKKIVYVDSVRYNFIPEPNARVAAVQAGNADVASQIPLSLSKRVAGNAQFGVQQVFPGCQQVFFTQTQNKPTDNPLVRRAIQAVMGVDDIMDSVGEVTKRNAQFSYPGTTYYTPGTPDFHYDMHDVDKAKALLKEAGYKGEKIVLQTTAAYSWHLSATLVLSEQMKAAGMNVDVQTVDWNTMSNDRMRGTGGWNVSLTNYCSQPLLGPQQWRPFILTVPQAKDDHFMEEAYQRFFQSPQLADRQKAWTDIQQHITDEAYFIKVGDYGSINVFRTRVHDLVPWYNIRFWGVWRD